MFRDKRRRIPNRNLSPSLGSRRSSARRPGIEVLEERVVLSQASPSPHEIYAWVLINKMREDPAKFGQELYDLYHKNVRSAHGMSSSDPVWDDIREAIRLEEGQFNRTNWYTGFNNNVPGNIRQTSLSVLRSLPRNGPLALDNDLQLGAWEHNDWMHDHGYYGHSDNPLSTHSKIPGLTFVNPSQPDHFELPEQFTTGNGWTKGENIGYSSTRTSENIRHPMANTRAAYDRGEIDAQGYYARVAYMDTIGFILDWGGNGPTPPPDYQGEWHPFGHLKNLAGVDQRDQFGLGLSSGPKNKTLGVKNAIGVDIYRYQHPSERQDDLQESTMTTHRLSARGLGEEGGYIVGLIYEDTDGNGVYTPGEGINNYNFSLGIFHDGFGIENGTGSTSIIHGPELISEWQFENGEYTVTAKAGGRNLGTQVVYINNNNALVEFRFSPGFGLTDTGGGPPRMAADLDEPNNVPERAIQLGDSSGGLTLHDRRIDSIHNDNDIDWFRFDLVETGRPGDRIFIGFDHEEGDLEADLYRLNNYGDTDLIATSHSLTDNEEFDLDGLDPGTYFVRVRGFFGATNFYSLQVDIDKPNTTAKHQADDYDGDGLTDPVVFEPSTSTFYIAMSNGEAQAIQFGQGTLWGGHPIPVPGDYDGDGLTDPAVFEPSTSTFYIAMSSQAGQAIQFGQGTNWGGHPIPVPGDYDGDGLTDPAVFEPSTSTFYIAMSSQAGQAFQFGQGTNWGGNPIPVPGDYDGDGLIDPAVFEPSTSTFFQARSRDGGTSQQFGQGTLWGGNPVPIPADYDGDGLTDPAVFEPSTSTFYLARSRDGGMSRQFGPGSNWGGGPIPIPADYDGDGLIDPAVFEPSTSTFYLARSRDGATSRQFGQGTRWGGQPIVVPADYDGDGLADPAVFDPITATFFLARSRDGGLVKQFGQGRAYGGDPKPLPLPLALQLGRHHRF